MIRGDFIEQYSVEDLNTIRTFEVAGTGDEYFNYIGTALYDSEGIRSQGIEAGYKILKIYPCYHQGWEMDAWGAIGEKDGKKYVLETDHDSLCYGHEIETSGIKKLITTILSFTGLD